MFRRGFKTWAEETALKMRQQLGIAPFQPLDPVGLAAALNIPVLGPSELAELAADVRARLLNQHSDSWSAITIRDGNHHLIITNSAHSPARQNSDLMHELAHILMNHEPAMMFMNPASGIALRTHNKEQEDEANWLCGCLLLPREALLHVRRKRMTDDEVCGEYGVSLPMLRFRLNTTGVDVQLRRTRSFGR
jgi:Zn-dependent peptidase ImmA (M78 family)